MIEELPSADKNRGLSSRNVRLFLHVQIALPLCRKGFRGAPSGAQSFRFMKGCMKKPPAGQSFFCPSPLLPSFPKAGIPLRLFPPPLGEDGLRTRTPRPSPSSLRFGSPLLMKVQTVP